LSIISTGRQQADGIASCRVDRPTLPHSLIGHCFLPRLPPLLQAEETAAKLRELEADMLLRRQEHRSGVSCGCLVISWSKDHLPDHLRVWEMTLT
jgi:hypothetical protein